MMIVLPFPLDRRACDLEVVGVDDPLREQRPLERREPALVVPVARVGGAVAALPKRRSRRSAARGMPRSDDLRVVERHRDAEGTALPGLGEHELAVRPRRRRGPSAEATTGSTPLTRERRPARCRSCCRVSRDRPAPRSSFRCRTAARAGRGSAPRSSSPTRGSRPRAAARRRTREARPRLRDDTGAIRRALVPGRRQAEDGPGVARAEGADDDVVDFRGVLDDHHRVPLEASVAELADRGGPVRAQPLAVPRIHPRPSDDSRAVLRPEVALVALDDRIDLVGRRSPSRPGPPRARPPSAPARRDDGRGRDSRRLQVALEEVQDHRPSTLGRGRGSSEVNATA